MTQLLFKSGDDWTEEILDAAWTEIEKIGREELKVSFYKPQIEIVSAKQMLDAYTSVGMPIYYKHWSFGKEYVQIEKEYRAGRMGLAYELVINSDPCIAYLMEENNALVQTMVMAHANVGHAAVFKNNYLFKTNTDASSIVDYLAFAKRYLKLCEERYGTNEVEEVLDACHALAIYGVDKYKKARALSREQEERRALERFNRELDEYDEIWEKVGKRRKAGTEAVGEREVHALKEPQENILYFVEKNAPHLPDWKREVIRIVRNIESYFSPQRPTKVLNEGYATFTHYYIMHRLHEKGLIDAGSMLEFYVYHSGVIAQWDLAQLNPYKLGFAIFSDIKRMCEDPTPEDKRYFPNLVGKDWVEQVNYAMENFKDETFILQYLSPKVARDLKLFSYNDPWILEDSVEVMDISNERGFYDLRNKLANQYAFENAIPDVQITHVDTKGTRKLVLKHFVKNGIPLDIDDANAVIRHLSSLWEYSVVLETAFYDEDGELRPRNLIATGKYVNLGTGEAKGSER